ncbi:MAG TPA: HD domain-containing protein [Steroidobacteraceae bacterium]|nr:HD domain-containing protein [Steroidobacteraceae bacterium]
MSAAAEILALYGARGAGAYFGERVSMTEHGLQAAHFAGAEAAPEALVLAALLHDVGHLVEPVPDELADWTSDARHEELGARWLARRFPREVSEPVRLHVPAKRYLCATDATYGARLSPASVHTLALQGGPMSAAEVQKFRDEPFGSDAVRLRRWDDQGKVAGLRTQALRDYVGLIERWATAPL